MTVANCLKAEPKPEEKSLIGFKASLFCVKRQFVKT